MLKHYTNLNVENVQESLDNLNKLGITASMGDPATTGNISRLVGRPYTMEEIRGFGVRGIWIESDDPRPAITVVNDAWSAWVAVNGIDDDDDA